MDGHQPLVDVFEPYVAFAVPADPRASGVEVRVNFGLLSGREATPAEIDELARRLLSTVERVTIVSERRHEISDQVEASVHQVSIAVAQEGVPRDVIEAARLEGKLVALAEGWAHACSGERGAAV